LFTVAWDPESADDVDVKAAGVEAGASVLADVSVAPELLLAAGASVELLSLGCERVSVE
jgi:hypothetical protein